LSDAGRARYGMECGAESTVIAVTRAVFLSGMCGRCDNRQVSMRRNDG
jgi:hypothetical protein